MSLIIYKKNIQMSGENPIKSLRLHMESNDMHDSGAFSINLQLEIKSDENEHHLYERNEEVKDHNQYVPNRKYDFYTHEVANSFENLGDVETDGGWDPNWDEEIEEISDDEENSIKEETRNDGFNWNDEFDDDNPEEMSDEDCGDGFAPFSFFKNEREALEIWGIGEEYEQG